MHHFLVAQVLLILATLTGCFAAPYDYHLSLSEEPEEFVILVHGLRARSRVFEKMKDALLSNGYSVCLVDYPSRRDSLQTMAETVLGEAVRRCENAGAQKISFVAHSMGAILVRYFLQEHKLPNIGRVVFLCPPNHGTALVDKFEWSWLFRVINGPGGMALGAAPDGFIQTLELPYYEFGVLMSKKTINPIASAFIPGKDDGRVSIESAKLDGMKDFKLINSNHHVIMKKKETIRQVIAFLCKGNFE